MILVIGKENCSNCEEVVSFLNNKNIKFEHMNIETFDEENQKEIKQMAIKNKIMSFPLIMVDGDMMTFNDLKNKLIPKVVKRDGSKVLFDKSKIINAIDNAIFEVNNENLNNVSKEIADKIESISSNKTLKVDDIQEIVENELKLKDENLYNRYSSYRILKDKERKIKAKMQPQKRLLSDEFISKYKHIKNPMTPLGEFTYYRTYSRWIPELNRREYWWETVQRVVEYNCSLLPTSVEEAEKLYDNMFNLRQLPSGRSLWIAGTKSSEDFPLSNFNCSGVVIDNFKKFGELFHALLVGAGVGFRVLKEDVDKLPNVRNNIEIIHKPYNPVPKKSRNEYTSLRFRKNKVEIVVGDSKIGWIKALDSLLDFVSSKDYKYVNTIIFNYNHVRPLGERLKTFGGYSSGHTSLKNMIEKIFVIINNRVESGFNKLRPIDCMDIANIIAENVVVGGEPKSLCLPHK